MREERKLHLLNFITGVGKRGRRSGEWRKRREDNGVNASRQAAAVLGLITHTSVSLGTEVGGKPVFDLKIIH